MTNTVLYTIGYGNRGTAAFFALLPAGCIVIDVRQSPRGWNNAYTRESLRAQLGAARYHWYRALGNVSGSANRWRSPEDDYQRDNALRAVADLLTNPASPPIVLMCAERNPNNCHRRLVAQALTYKVPGLLIKHLT